MKLTMRDYVAMTPETLRRNIARENELTGDLVAAFLRKPYRSIRVIASGSSYNGAICARHAMRRLLGIEVLVTPPYTFVRHECELPDDQFVFVVSQSGYSTNAIAALECIRERGRTAIGLTGDIKSDMRAHCDWLIDYGAGEETVGYVTRGVTALCVFLILFAARACLGKGGDPSSLRRELMRALEANQAAIPAADAFIDANYRELSSMQTVFLCGDGAGYGLALEGALKIAEMLRLPALALETEEFLHGPNLQLSPNHTVFFIGGGTEEGQAIRLYQACRLVTQRAYLIASEKTLSEKGVFHIPQTADLSAVCALPLFQLMAYRLTQDAHLWHKHPLYRRFEQAVKGKTPGYVDKEVL